MHAVLIASKNILNRAIEYVVKNWEPEQPFCSCSELYIDPHRAQSTRKVVGHFNRHEVLSIESYRLPWAPSQRRQDKQ